MNSTVDPIDMSHSESLRKLNQLRLTLLPESQERKVDADGISKSDLAYLVEGDKELDHTDLIPFIVSAIQGIDRRLLRIEQALQH